MEISCSPSAAAMNNHLAVDDDGSKPDIEISSESSSSILSGASNSTTRSSTRRKSSMKQDTQAKTKLRNLNNVKFESEIPVSPIVNGNSNNSQVLLNGNSREESELVKDENRPMVRTSARRPATPKPLPVNRKFLKKTTKLENVTSNVENQDKMSQNSEEMSTPTKTIKKNHMKSPMKNHRPVVNGRKTPVLCLNDENTLDGFNTPKSQKLPIVNENINGHNTNNNNNNITETEPNENNAQPITQFNLDNNKDINKTKKLSVVEENEISMSLSNSPHMNVVDVLNNNDENSQLSNGPLNQEDESQTGSTSQQDSNGPNLNGPKIKKQRKKRVSHYNLSDQIHSSFNSVEHLFIYKWPQSEEKTDNKDNSILNSEAPDTYLLQEQISEFLGIKSFKRKYPDLSRRLIDIKERVYLKENKVVTETQCDLGLTALKLNDCLDIMVDHHPEKFTELNAHLAKKKRKEMANAAQKSVEILTEPVKTGRFGRVILSEAERMKELMKKAMKSATTYNANLNKEKKTDRGSYFDLQTMRIQYKRHEKIVKPSGNNNQPNGQYPVALLHGQYQYHYKKYTTDELKHLPLNTILYQAETPVPLLYDEWKMKQQNPNKHYKTFKKVESSDDEGERLEIEPHHTPKHYEPKKKEKQTVNSHLLSQHLINQSINSPNSSNLRITASAAPTVANLINQQKMQHIPKPTVVPAPQKVEPIFKSCYVCNKQSQSNNPNPDLTKTDKFMIHCSSCDRYTHPICLELNPELVRWGSILEYNWQCMDCKKCSGCLKPHDEDKMMFCDRCDRGFHTYCVGLEEVPIGSWFCKKCPDTQKPIENKFHFGQVNRIGIDESNSNSIIKTELSTPGRISTPKFIIDKMKSLTTPKERTSASGKRGRPPGSLNKPKDPNSPKKSLKSTKIKKLDHSMLNYSYGDISGIHENSNTNPMSVDEQMSYGGHDEHSQSLSYDNFNNNIMNVVNPMSQANNENFMQSTF